jgi:hypothetical protein
MSSGLTPGQRERLARLLEEELRAASCASRADPDVLDRLVGEARRAVDSLTRAEEAEAAGDPGPGRPDRAPHGEI